MMTVIYFIHLSLNTSYVESNHVVTLSPKMKFSVDEQTQEVNNLALLIIVPRMERF